MRPAFDALFGIDAVFGQVVGTTTQPALGAIRLAWWREALERLDHAAPPPEPRLQAVARELIPRGIAGREVGAIEQGWCALLDEQSDIDAVASRGETLFKLGARLLGSDDPQLAAAGRQFALGDAFRRGLTSAVLPDLARHRFPARLRPLTALARLAARDPSEPEATPGRAWALLAHRWSGRV